LRWEPFVSAVCWLVYQAFYRPGPIIRFYRAPDSAVYDYFLPVFALLAFGFVLGCSGFRRSRGWSRWLAAVFTGFNALSILFWLTLLLPHVA